MRWQIGIFLRVTLAIYVPLLITSNGQSCEESSTWSEALLTGGPGGFLTHGPGGFLMPMSWLHFIFSHGSLPMSQKVGALKTPTVKISVCWSISNS